MGRGMREREGGKGRGREREKGGKEGRERGREEGRKGKEGKKINRVRVSCQLLQGSGVIPLCFSSVIPLPQFSRVGSVIVV